MKNTPKWVGVVGLETFLVLLTADSVTAGEKRKTQAGRQARMHAGEGFPNPRSLASSWDKVLGRPVPEATTLTVTASNNPCEP